MRFPNSSSKGFVSKRGFRKQSLIAKVVPFQIRNDFKTFSKLVLFDSNKMEATLCLQN
jgi:hypothetical protein